MKFLLKVLSTVFFIGYIPFASGTFGSLMGIVIWILISNSRFYYGFIFIFIFMSFIITHYSEKIVFKRDDPSEIVLDEVCGMLVTFIPFRFSHTLKSAIIIIFGFVLFRIFDILKPQPIKISQRLPGGIGVTIDDIISGIFSSFILLVFNWFVFNRYF